MAPRLAPVVIAALALAALAGPAAAQPAVVQEAFPGLRFVRPVGVEATADGRLYVIEQGSDVAPVAPSRVLTFRPGDAAPTVFLDLSARVRAAGEAGLLGLAFHPDYATNGRLFVSYTAPVSSPKSGERVLESRVSEFARSASDPLQADDASERVLLRVDQPATNHNGGTVDFGPDGLLYIGLGDGGGGGDPYKNGQDPSTLLGAILRVDVDDVPSGQAYGIPAGNPFAASGGPERKEIFAYGLRNPFKFDAGPSGVWAGDVGQGAWEEVDVVLAGRNYGWPVVEGPACYPPGASCSLDAYEAPVAWYAHGELTGRSITGGYVVEGTGTSLSGHYLYGDFDSGRLWALDVSSVGGAGPASTQLVFETVPTSGGGTRTINISSIDDAGGRILVTDYGGTVFEVVPSATGVDPEPEPSAPALAVVGPNPTRSRTALAVSGAGPVRVVLVDALGREVARLWDGAAAPARLAVDVSGLAPGVYTAVASGAGGRAAVRLVVAR